MPFAPMVSTFPIRSFGFTCPGFGVGNPASANWKPQRRRALPLNPALSRSPSLRLDPAPPPDPFRNLREQREKKQSDGFIYDPFSIQRQLID
jgi:hypothetical protein